MNKKKPKLIDYNFIDLPIKKSILKFKKNSKY